MFRYNSTTHIIEDQERGLAVTQTGGPGHGYYAGMMTPHDGSWTFRFLVHYREVETTDIDHPRFVHLGNGRGLVMRVRPPEGVWDRTETPEQLAREAIFARAMYHRSFAHSNPTD